MSANVPPLQKQPNLLLQKKNGSLTGHVLTLPSDMGKSAGLYDWKWLSTACAGFQEDSINMPGLMFSALDSDNLPTRIAYYNLKYTPALDALDPDTWCKGWLQRILKHPEIKHLFAHKVEVPTEEYEE